MGATKGVRGTYKEGNEDGGVHQNQRQDGSQAIAETVGDGSGQEDADKGATLAGLEEGALPFGRDGVAGALDEDTIMLLESGKRDKVAVEEHVERLHDLGRKQLATCGGDWAGGRPDAGK